MVVNKMKGRKRVFMSRANLWQSMGWKVVRNIDWLAINTCKGYLGLILFNFQLGFNIREEIPSPPSKLMHQIKKTKED